RAFFDFVGEMLNGVGAGDRVEGVGDAGFMREDLLGAESDQGGVFGGQCESFVERICVQGLAAAKNGSESLNRDPDDVVLRLLRSEGRAGSLRVEAQQ